MCIDSQMCLASASQVNNLDLAKLAKSFGFSAPPKVELNLKAKAPRGVEGRRLARRYRARRHASRERRGSTRATRSPPPTRALRRRDAPRLNLQGVSNVDGEGETQVREPAIVRQAPVRALGREHCPTEFAPGGEPREAAVLLRPPDPVHIHPRSIWARTCE